VDQRGTHQQKRDSPHRVPEPGGWRVIRIFAAFKGFRGSNARGLLAWGKWRLINFRSTMVEAGGTPLPKYEG